MKILVILGFKLNLNGEMNIILKNIRKYKVKYIYL